MKIALLSYEYPHETGFGGIGTYTWYQARALARLGHQVHVLAGSIRATSLRTEEHDGVLVHRYRSTGLAMGGFGWFGDTFRLEWTKNRLQNGLSMYRGLSRLLKAHHFDLVEAPECGADAWLVARLLDVPLVVRFHSPARLIMPFYEVTPRDIRYCSAIEQSAIVRADGLSSCSRFLASEVRRELDVRDDVAVIPNGIDLDLFDAEDDMDQDVHRAYGLPTGRPLILFAGRIEPRKGMALLPAIVRDILTRFEVTFVFAGRDPYGFMASTLLPLASTLPVRGSVHHLGAIELPAVRRCLRAADVFLLPSLWENCPYACVEAMAAGRAVVATDQGGVPELVEHDVDGLLARSGDAASYVEQLGRAISDPGLRERLGRAARNRVERTLTDANIARQSVEFYRRCLRGARPAG